MCRMQQRAKGNSRFRWSLAATSRDALPKWRPARAADGLHAGLHSQQQGAWKTTVLSGSQAQRESNLTREKADQKEVVSPSGADLMSVCGHPTAISTPGQTQTDVDFAHKKSEFPQGRARSSNPREKGGGRGAYSLTVERHRT